VIIPSTKAQTAPFIIPAEDFVSKPLYTLETIAIYRANLPFRLISTINTKVSE